MFMLSYFENLKKIWNHSSNRNNRIGAIYRVIKWWLGARIQEKTIEIDAFGYKIKLYPDAFMTRGIVFYTPLLDYDMMHFIQRYLKPGDSFIDIGANIGLYTLLASSLVGKNGHIDSFEPVPKTVKRLKENISINKLTQVQIHPIALGEKDSTLQFTQEHDATNHVLNFNRDNNVNSIEVSSKRLDRVISDRNYAMAKIDVEGWELPLLKGAENLLSSNNPPVLMLEINGSFTKYGYKASDIINYLNSLGYDSARYDANKNELIFTKEVWDDVLFISRIDKDKVLAKIN